MTVVEWSASQLLSYSTLHWLAFVGIAVAASYLYRLPGVLFGHVLVAMVLWAFDVMWVQSEMHKPGWNGQPDQDIVFFFGVLLRVLLVNTALLPVSLLVLRLSRKMRVELAGSR